MANSNQFALGLYRNIASESDGENIFFSPISICTAVSMIYAGARGKTSDEIKEALKLEHEPTNDDAHKWIQKIWNDLTSKNKGVTLSLANNAWVNETFKITKDFKDILTKFYNVSPCSGDFAQNVEKVRQEINKWVENETNDKIKELLPSGSLNSLTKVVIVNAIYFYGDWAKTFPKDRTVKDTFFPTAKSQIEVEMMSQEDNFKYLEDDWLESKVLSLPYKDSSMSCVIILPNQINGLNEVEKKIFAQDKYEKLEIILQRLTTSQEVKVRVKLPKFKFENSMSIKKHLISLGLNDIFSPKDANLSGIAESEKLFVSDAFHKAFIDVTETGTEAAAATGMVMMLTCIIEEKLYFDCDHPFMFFIYDQYTQMILFMGRVSNLK